MPVRVILRSPANSLLSSLQALTQRGEPEPPGAQSEHVFIRKQCLQSQVPQVMMLMFSTLHLLVHLIRAHALNPITPVFSQSSQVQQLDSESLPSPPNLIMGYQENSSNACSCPSYSPEWVGILTRFAESEGNGPWGNHSRKPRRCSGLRFFRLCYRYKNLFEKGSAGQIHEDFRATQRIKEKRAGSVCEKHVSHLECTSGFSLILLIMFSLYLRHCVECFICIII